MNSKEIRSQISKLLTDQQAIAVKGFNTESRSAFDKMQAQVESLESDFQRVSALEQRSAHEQEFRRSPRPNIGNGGLHGGTGDNKAERRRASEAFKSYALTGVIPAEHRDILTSTASGALIPQLFDPEIVTAEKFHGPILGAVKKKITDSMAPLKLAKIDDTSNGLSLIAEGNTVTEADPNFSGVVLNADNLNTGLILVSFEALEDSEFSLADLVSDSFAVRWARGMERAITLGVDGNNVVLPSFPTGGLAASATVAATTTSLANGITYNNLVSLYGSLDTAYVQNASWIMHPTVRSQLLGALDGFGRPLFQPNPATSEPFAFLMGQPVILNAAMPVANTASSQPIILTDLSRTFLLRQQTQPLSVLRLNERYADQLAVGFFGWTRTAGAIIAPSSVTAIASLKLAAS